jgi:A/G-specific adenine glycosylase
MLQQTQVDRVLPKYQEVARPISVAGGAGRRARGGRRQDLVSAGVQHPAAPAAGRSPANRSRILTGRSRTTDTLRSFKGIGAYTAGAVMSFAFGKRAAILDTNVARVLFRLFVGRGERDSGAMEKHLWEISRAVLPHRHVFDFNQALMDFGATLCNARKPQCMICPMTSRCRAYPFNPEHER